MKRMARILKVCNIVRQTRVRVYLSRIKMYHLKNVDCVESYFLFMVVNTCLPKEDELLFACHDWKDFIVDLDIIVFRAPHNWATVFVH